MQDAPIEEIAKAVGIARGLIYRQFSSKEELYVLTVTNYLDELADILAAAVDAERRGPEAQLERCAETYAGYCQRFPAFLDCSLSLMHGPARGLYERVSESVWLRLGQSMTACTDQLAQILRDGNATGAFALEDPDYTSNLLWTQTLGAMHLARIGVGVKRLGPGVPGLFAVDAAQVVRSCAASALATVRSPGA